MYALVQTLMVYKLSYEYKPPQWQNHNNKYEQLWIFESALFTFPILGMRHTLFANRELNNIQAIRPSQEEDRHHSNSRKFEKLWAGSSSGGGGGSSSACVESLDWNRYTLIGSKSDSSGGEMRYGKERGEATPRPRNALRSKLPDLKRVLQTSCPHYVFIVCIIACISPHFVHQVWGRSRGCTQGLHSQLFPERFCLKKKNSYEVILFALTLNFTDGWWF